MTPSECERIYNEAYRAVYWTAMSLLGNEAEAEDVVQDTFVTMLESYDTLQDKTKVVPWLKKICANKCLNHLSRTKTDSVEQEFFDDAEYVPEDFLPESIVESEERRKIIMDIINRSLSEDIRRTIILFYFDEMSTREIADAMGIPQGTVLWRLNYARKKIKREVEKYEKETDTKLHAVALPFLALLFMKEAEMVPLRPMPASLAELSASTGASMGEAGTSIAAKAIRKGTGIMMKKLLIVLLSIVFVGGAAAGIYFATRSEEEGSSGSKNRKAKKKTESMFNGEGGVFGEDENSDEGNGNGNGKGDAIGGDSTDGEPEFGTEEYWLSQMFLIDVNDEATLKRIIDTLFNCEPKLGEDKHILYDKVVGSIGKQPMSTGMWCNHNTFDFEFSFENGYVGYDRLWDFGYWNYETEPNPSLADPGKVISYENNLLNPTRKGAGDVLFLIYDEQRAQKLFKFCCDYITEYYAKYNPGVENDFLGFPGYCLTCGDGVMEYYAYVRIRHDDYDDKWEIYLENFFDDPDLMDAFDELNKPADQQEQQND